MQLARTYKIETKRCVIRCYAPEDLLKVHEAILLSSDHLRPWLPWMQQEPKSIEARMELIRRFRGQFDMGLDYVFGIFDRTGNELIGSTGLHTRVGKNAREIGYWINVKYARQGYATEAVSALTKAAFEVEGMSRIEIHCEPENTGSRRIPFKLGYKMESIAPNNSFGEKRDIMIWAMSKEEYGRSGLRGMPLRAFDFRGEEIRWT